MGEQVWDQRQPGQHARQEEARVTEEQVHAGKQGADAFFQRDAGQGKVVGKGGFPKLREDARQREIGKPGGPYRAKPQRHQAHAAQQGRQAALGGELDQQRRAHRHARACHRLLERGSHRQRRANGKEAPAGPGQSVQVQRQKDGRELEWQRVFFGQVAALVDKGQVEQERAGRQEGGQRAVEAAQEGEAQQAGGGERNQLDGPHAPAAALPEPQPQCVQVKDQRRLVVVPVPEGQVTLTDFFADEEEDRAVGVWGMVERRDGRQQGNHRQQQDGSKPQVGGWNGMCGGNCQGICPHGDPLAHGFAGCRR